MDADAPHAAEAVAAGMLEELPDGSSALVLAIEHLWAIPCGMPSATPAGSSWGIAR